MIIQTVSRKSEIDGFLREVKAILSSESFCIDRDFVFQEIRANDELEDEFTNVNTLLALDYCTSDVIDEIKQLTVEDYCESMVDNQKPEFNVFHVFGKRIQNRDVYIKVRLKERMSSNDKFVFCISFHFARYPLTSFPYRRKSSSV